MGLSLCECNPREGLEMPALLIIHDPLPVPGRAIADKSAMEDGATGEFKQKWNGIAARFRAPDWHSRKVSGRSGVQKQARILAGLWIPIDEHNRLVAGRAIGTHIPRHFV